MLQPELDSHQCERGPSPLVGEAGVRVVDDRPRSDDSLLSLYLRLQQGGAVSLPHGPFTFLMERFCSPCCR